MRFVLLILALSGLLAPGFCGPIEDLEPGCWYEVPSTHLQDCPDRALPSQFPWLTTGFGAIMNVWCGGAYDTQRERMLIGPGGGHASYNGNEVYGFDLNDFLWRRLSDPDPVLPAQSECTADSVPFAMHTYDGGDYLPPPIDRYMLEGGWCTEGTYAFDFNARRWEKFTKSGLPRTGDEAAVDLMTGTYYFISGMTGTLAAFDYKSQSWSNIGGNGSTYYATMTFDTKRRLLVSVGGGSLRTWDVTTTPVTFAARASTGDTTMVRANNPGCEYDPVMDRVVCWWGGADVYLLNTADWSWEKRSPASGNTVTPPQPLANGTYGRFRYVPSKNVYVLANDVAQNVFIYRLSAGTPVIPVRLDAVLSRDTVEAELSVTVSAGIVYSDLGSHAADDSLFLTSLDPLIATVSGRSVIGVSSGTARILAGCTDRRFGKAVYDTLRVTVVPLSGGLTLDSIVINHPVAGVVTGDTIALHATGYYSKGADLVVRNVDTVADWTSSSPSSLTVTDGATAGLSAGGPFDVIVSLDGKSDTARTTVYAEAPVTRINFQISSTPWKEGWLADNGGAYSDGAGYGWTSGSGFSTRDDRLGSNFLLKSLVATPGESGYRINVPDGRYWLRLGLGDNQWGGSFTYIRMGTDTLCTFVSGANTITTDLIAVTGGNGLALMVNGSINYIVLLPDNGMDINRYADDGYIPPLAAKGMEKPPVAGGLPDIYPNPFNPAVTFDFHGSRDIKELSVYDTRGCKVADLTAQARMGKTVWEPVLPSGMYIARLTVGTRTVSRRLILMK